MLDFHNLSVTAVLHKLKTNTNGLTPEIAEKRLIKHGLNSMPEAKPLSGLLIFLSQFNNALIYILLVTGALSLLIGAYKEAYVIFGAVIINVIIGFIQERKANQAISKLRNLVEHKALVLRDGQEIVIDSKQVTIGDIILIKAGNRMPADGRLIEAADLQVDEAGLTGESLPSNKKTAPVASGASLADRENMVYAGTMAVRGLGKAAVTATGVNTEIGKIAVMVKETHEEPTPLQKKLTKFSRLLGLVFIVVCIIIVLVGLCQGRGWHEMLITGVAVGVASIPEGLTVSVTVILAIGMRRILKKKALTRKLVAAETLGSTTVICTDKTGTLTEGKMHVAHIIIGENEFEIKTKGSRQDRQEAKAVSLALQAAMMCNDAVVENPLDELGSWRIIGSPTEAALLSAAIQSGLRKEDLLKIEPKIDELPFSSEHKYMLSLHEADENKYILYEKGASEILLAKAKSFYHHGELTPLDNQALAKLNSTYEKLTNRGLRVIGLARRVFSKKELFINDQGKIEWSSVDKDLDFIGFIAIKDPLRAEAKETIALAKQAGIRTVIITGDHKLTAKAIAEEIGIKVKAANIITGEELDTINDERLKKVVKMIDIYARVSPHHKLRIVKALKELGEVVAMTGDGINDSPALKAADIGISLGTGTDIAKETSDIVLLDNNFKTIVSTIRQGRIIFRNIRKVITYLISDSFSEIILIVGSLFFNTPLAILPAQILWINIVNDGLPHFSLAFEKGDDSIMQEKPIAKNENLLNKEMKVIIFGAGIMRDLFIFVLFYWLWRKTAGEIEYLRTLMFAILGVKSLMTIFSLRRFRASLWQYNPFSNRYLVAAVGASFLFLLAGIYWRPLQLILGTTDLNLPAWAVVFAVSTLSIVLIEMVKKYFIIHPSYKS